MRLLKYARRLLAADKAPEWRCRCSDLNGATICEYCYQRGKKEKRHASTKGPSTGIGAKRQNAD